MSFALGENWRGNYGSYLSGPFMNAAQVLAHGDSTLLRVGDVMIGVLHCWKIDGKWHGEYKTVDEVRARVAQEVQARSLKRQGDSGASARSNLLQRDQEGETDGVGDTAREA
jgi:hypothetical protein